MTGSRSEAVARVLMQSLAEPHEDGLGTLARPGDDSALLDRALALIAELLSARYPGAEVSVLDVYSESGRKLSSILFPSGSGIRWELPPGYGPAEVSRITVNAPYERRE